MTQPNPFRLHAKNSLKVNEVYPPNEKTALLTFKSGHDLRKQLSKSKQNKTGQQIISKTQFLQKTNKITKNQQQLQYQQVAALEHFKPAVTRQKTKDLIQNIKIRRRQKHIDALSRFKEDLDDYKENLLGIYNSLLQDTKQVLSISQNQMDNHFNTLSDEYLLSREKQFLQQLQTQTREFKQSTIGKITSAKGQVERIKTSRSSVVSETCIAIREVLIDIAFVLEPQARQIELKQKQEIQKLQEKYYTQTLQQLQSIEKAQIQKNEEIQKKSEDIALHWKELKEKFELQQYQRNTNENQYRNPQRRRKNYNLLIDLQLQNHQRKKTILESLLDDSPDTLTKNNAEKWNDVIKTINDKFNDALDQLMKQMKEQLQISKKNNENRYLHLKNRMIYIGLHSQQEIQQILKQKSQGLLQRNNKQAFDLLKNATQYAQNQDERQNNMIEALYNLFLKLATKNDEFNQDFNSLNQKYQIQKAKILDEDEQTNDKLNEQLNSLKKQLRQSLHHIKLDDIEKKCFDKIDEIQKAYRETHDKNKALASQRPSSLNQFMKLFQAKIAEVFQLYDLSRKAELLQKNKQQAEKQALKKIQLEDKLKAQEEAKAAQQIKKKTGKAPAPPKPKDPKKAAAQLQQRKKAILAAMGQKTIEEMKTQSGSTWLVFRTMEQICEQFFKQIPHEQNEQNSPPQQQPPQQNAEQKQKTQKKQLAPDQLEQTVKDVRGQAVVTDQAFFKIKQIANYLLEFRNKFFDSIGTKKNRILKSSQNSDNEMLQESLTNLDLRLKEHYSMKGKLQSEVYLKRSGQITNHKKKYEKYVRTIKEKMDLQTQQFNFLLQKSLQLMKNHNTAQKQTKQQISTGKNLSELQGLLSKARNNSSQFAIQIKQKCIDLNRLANADIDYLLKKNDDFIKECKLLTEGGQYSQEQIDWYKTMIQQINTQIEEQKAKRIQKMKEIQQHCEKRRKQLIQNFEKEYAATIQELSAKDGTGKKYGKPKRLAQEKIRYEMNKCEQAQLSIQNQIKAIQHQTIQAKKNHYIYNNNSKPPTLKWRQMLMSVQTCVTRYAKHIQALNQNLKINPMIRVNYDENLPQCTLTGNQQQDKARLKKELELLGPLSEQKDERVFTKYIQQIEKIISDQARTIYTGDKAKYLTGNDKIPDFLRTYIENMKKNAEQFRLNCIRQLRESCLHLANLSEEISNLFMLSLLQFYSNNNHTNFSMHNKQILDLNKNHYQLKQINLKKLRPNLSNPQCQDQLKILDNQEKTRSADFISAINDLKTKFENLHFENASQYLNCILNNFQFLLLFIDACYWQEDFVKVPGDKTEEKKHLEINKLMLMKQKGMKIDTNSQRNIRKKWEGINFTIFNIGQRKFVYNKVVEEPKQKDKKGAKKQAKDKKAVEQPPQQAEKSKDIQTFKTWRQKAVAIARQNSLEKFKNFFDSCLKKISDQVSNGLNENENFKQKWTNIAKQLYL